MTQPRFKPPKPGTCRVCGCTDDNACTDFGPCHWVDPEHTLCSACEGTPADLAYALSSIAHMRGKASRPALAIKLAVKLANDALTRLDARSSKMLQNLAARHHRVAKGVDAL